MASQNAKRDENNVPTLIAVDSTDGTTIVRIRVNPTNNGLKISDASTGTDFGTVNAKRDENNVPCLMAVSSVDGTTPVAVYTTSAGLLLVDSN